MRLDGRRALVTGASRGIGRAVTEAFAAEGADVSAAARTTEALERVASDCADHPGAVTPVTMDVREAGSVERAVERSTESLGGLDALVNNAGVIARGSLAETPPAERERLVDTNLHGVLRVTRAALPALRRGDDDACVVNLSSVVARRAATDLSVYAATKGAVEALTTNLAAELAPDVRVNAVAPGTVATPMNEAAREDEAWVRERREATPMGRLGDPADVASAVRFLVSAEAGWVTGETLAVDGGMSV